MKREDIKKFFPDATEEQLKGLLDINTADIGKAKGAGNRQGELGESQRHPQGI